MKDRRRVERVPEMMQPERDLVGEAFGVEGDPLVGTAMVGMLHDIARGLVDRQLEGPDAIIVDRRGKMTAKSAHEFARSAKLFEIATELHLGTRESKLWLFYFERHAGQVIDQPARLGKSDGRFTDCFPQCLGLEFAVGRDATQQAVPTKQLSCKATGF